MEKKKEAQRYKKNFCSKIAVKFHYKFKLDISFFLKNKNALVIKKQVIYFDAYTKSQYSD
jgi:hypothetical protein